MNTLAAMLDPAGTKGSDTHVHANRSKPRPSRRRGLVALLAATLALPAIAVPGAAHAQLDFFRISVSGNYLAGVEALNDLDADAAADRLVRAAAAHPGDPLLLSRAFLSQLVAGRILEAAPMAREVLTVEPEDELAKLTLAAIAFEEGRYDASIAALEGMSDISIIGITGQVLRGWAQLGAGDAAAAEATLSGLEESGFGAFLTLHRALLAEQAGDTEAALAFASQAYARDPLLVRTVEAYARIAANAGDFETARVVVEEFEALGTANPLISVIAGPIAAGESPGPFASSLDAGAAELLYGLGSALTSEGSTELGMVLLQLALFLDPGHGLATVAVSDVLAEMGQYASSSRVLSELPESSILHTSAQVRLAGNFDAAGNTPEAVARLRALAEREPGNREVLGALGDILRIDRQWEAATEVYDRLIAEVDADNPRNWRYFYVRGITLERSGAWERAEADFLTALDLNPGHPQILNYLGYTWVNLGMNLDEGLEMIEQAVALDPGNGYIVDSLGWAFYRLGRYEEAVVELERAVNLLPDDPELNDHLGDAYWRAGRRLEATFQWRIAADVDEDGEVRARALGKLADGLDPEDDGSESGAEAGAEMAAR